MEELARRFSGLSGVSPMAQKAQKILILCLVPSQGQVELPQAARLDQIAEQDEDEDVLAVTLATRVFKPDAPILTAKNVVKSPRLAALAQLVRDRLVDNVHSFANSKIAIPQLVGDVPVAETPEPKPPLNLDSGTKADTAAVTPAPVAGRPGKWQPVIAPDPTPIPVIP
jgi:hypothetical protein